jgi:hypothetical protein
LYVDGFAISDYRGLDRAGWWLDCAPGCLNAAYMTPIFSTLADACASIADRGSALARSVYSRHPRGLSDLGGVTFFVYRVQSEAFYGPDYRVEMCELKDAAEQLRRGRGNEPAWREAVRLRRLCKVDGALLPGATEQGTLFLFLSAAARLGRPTLTQTVHWPDQVVCAAARA